MAMMGDVVSSSTALLSANLSTHLAISHLQLFQSSNEDRKPVMTRKQKENMDQVTCSTKRVSRSIGDAPVRKSSTIARIAQKISIRTRINQSRSEYLNYS